MHELQLSGCVLAFLDKGVEEGPKATTYGDGNVVAVLAVEGRLLHEANAFANFAKGQAESTSKL